MPKQAKDKATGTGDFFAVDIIMVKKIIDDQGLREACAYLVMATGTGKDNRSTNWSANAVQNYTGISVRRAKDAINNLCAAGFVERLPGGSKKHPKYKLDVAADNEYSRFIYIPKQFTTGAADEKTPLERIRVSSDGGLLFLMLQVYDRSNIADDGGLSYDDVFVRYEAELMAEKGIYNLWGFNKNAVALEHEGIAKQHLDQSLSPNGYQPFWERLTKLQKLGLIYPCATVFDSEDGEVAFTLHDPFDGGKLNTLITEKPFDIMPESYLTRMEQHEFSVLIPSEYGTPVLKGIYVTRYRQKTKLTAAGMAAHLVRQTAYVNTLLEQYPNETVEQNLITADEYKTVADIKSAKGWYDPNFPDDIAF